MQYLVSLHHCNTLNLKVYLVLREDGKQGHFGGIGQKWFNWKY